MSDTIKSFLGLVPNTNKFHLIQTKEGFEVYEATKSEILYQIEQKIATTRSHYFIMSAVEKAKIGDVVGIFAENYTEVSGLGVLDGMIESDLTIALTAKTLPPGDLDDDNDVDFDDFAILAKNWLKGT